MGLYLVAAMASVAPVEAQHPSPDNRWEDASWVAGVGFALTNAAISGIVTGVFRSFSDDGSFWEGFRGGAAGGAVAYAGKRISAERFDGAGLLGRQIASLGGSLEANAREGRGPFDRITVQLGLGRLYWDRVASSVSFRPDILTLYYTTLGIVDSGVSLDWSRSLSAGAPVFLTEPGATTLDNNAAGRAYGGVVVIDVNAELPVAEIAAHERVHVLQYDEQFALWGEPLERGMVSHLGTTVGGVLGHADLGIGLLPMVPFIFLLPADANPFEIEANFLTARGGS